MESNTYYSSFTDITAQKVVEEQLRQSNVLLQRRQVEMDAELSLAARVQHSLAPRIYWNDICVETYYRAAHTIGGDFGVVFPHTDDVLTVVICNVSGHGISSALMANRIYSETLEHSRQKSRLTLPHRRVTSRSSTCWNCPDRFYNNKGRRSTPHPVESTTSKSAVSAVTKRLGWETSGNGFNYFPSAALH